METTYASALAEHWLDLPDAAEILGLSVDTVRRMRKRGELQSRQVPMPRGFKWEVLVPGKPVAPAQPALAEPMPDLSALLQLLREKDAALERVQRENTELAGRAGFWQGKAQQLESQFQQAQLQLQEQQETIKQLQAPAVVPAEHPKPWWKFWS